MTIEEAANNYASVTDPEAHGIDFIREVFIAGAEWDRGQMLKEAVEGYYEDKYVPAISLNKYLDLKDGDKVRVIICKKED